MASAGVFLRKKERRAEERKRKEEDSEQTTRLSFFFRSSGANKGKERKKREAMPLAYTAAAVKVGGVSSHYLCTERSTQVLCAR